MELARLAGYMSFGVLPPRVYHAALQNGSYTTQANLVSINRIDAYTPGSAGLAARNFDLSGVGMTAPFFLETRTLVPSSV